VELSADRQDDSNVHGIVDGQNFCTYYTYKPAGQSLLTSPWTPCKRLLARRDFSRETPRERLRWTPRKRFSRDSLQTSCERLLARDSSRETSRGGRRTQQPTRRRRWRQVTMMATTTTMATSDDNDDGDGKPFAPHERFLGLLARDSLRETPRKTPCKRLLSRDSSRESSWGGRRTQQPTMNGRRDGIR
jgi:hypothetical protein